MAKEGGGRGGPRRTTQGRASSALDLVGTCVHTVACGEVGDVLRPIQAPHKPGLGRGRDPLSVLLPCSSVTHRVVGNHLRQESHVIYDYPGDRAPCTLFLPSPPCVSAHGVILPTTNPTSPNGNNDSDTRCSAQALP